MREGLSTANVGAARSGGGVSVAREVATGSRRGGVMLMSNGQRETRNNQKAGGDVSEEEELAEQERTYGMKQSRVLYVFESAGGQE
jgi:hypothetical protein